MRIKENFKNLIPPLSSEEYGILEKSILEKGITDNIQYWVYCDKEKCDAGEPYKTIYLVDGHNRFEIAQKHDIKFDTTELEFEDENEVEIYIIEKQMGRRNINAYVRLELSSKYEDRIKIKVKEKERIRKSKSDSAINGEVDAFNEFFDIPEPIDTRKEVAKKAGVSHGMKSQFDKIKDSIDEETKDKLRSGDTTIGNVFKKVKAKEKQDKVEKYAKQAESIEIKSKLIDLRFGDFMEVLNDIPDNSIDLILTDPPYPQKYLNEWTKLGEFAEKKLKDGGFLIAYSGHMYLPTVINNVLQSGMKWYWLGSCLHGNMGEGKIAQVFEVNMFAKHKPILFFQKGGDKQKQENWTEDVFLSEIGSKDYHYWGQSVPIFDKIIKTFQPESIIDPFMGGGTTAIAAMINGIKCYGAEIDETAYNTSKKRINEYDEEQQSI